MLLRPMELHGLACFYFRFIECTLIHFRSRDTRDDTKDGAVLLRMPPKPTKDYHQRCTPASTSGKLSPEEQKGKRVQDVYI